MTGMLRGRGRWSNGRLPQIVEQGVGLANCIPIELLPTSVAHRFLVSLEKLTPRLIELPLCDVRFVRLINERIM